MTQRTRRDIALNLTRAKFDAEALALRNRLLAWRFANLGRIWIDPILADPELDDRLNQIGLPLLSVSPSADSRAQIVAALRRQQNSIADNLADTVAGEVFAVVNADYRPGDEIRPGDVSKEVNRLRAAANDMSVGDLPARQRVSAQAVGRIFQKEFELKKLPKSSAGARYVLTETRLASLRRRYGAAALEPSQKSQRHSSPETPSEKAPFAGQER